MRLPLGREGRRGAGAGGAAPDRRLGSLRGLGPSQCGQGRAASQGRHAAVRRTAQSEWKRCTGGRLCRRPAAAAMRELRQLRQQALVCRAPPRSTAAPGRLSGMHKHSPGLLRRPLGPPTTVRAGPWLLSACRPALASSPRSAHSHRAMHATFGQRSSQIQPTAGVASRECDPPRQRQLAVPQNLVGRASWLPLSLQRRHRAGRSPNKLLTTCRLV